MMYAEGGGGGQPYLLEARTRRRICRGGRGEVGGCSAGTPPEDGGSAPGGKPRGSADHRQSGGYLRQTNITARPPPGWRATHCPGSWWWPAGRRSESGTRPRCRRRGRTPGWGW